MLEPLSCQRHVAHVFGTVVSLDLRTDGPAEAAVGEAMAALHAIDAAFSTYRANSEVCRLDRGELLPCEASADVRWVLEQCRELRRRTGGAFDVRATGRLDPSAFVKGWAVEVAAARLQVAGLSDFTLSAGGDVLTRGAPAPGEPWRVGVQHPRDPAALAASLTVHGDLAIATSGAYARGDHVLDPRTGTPPRGVLSVTVCGPDLGRADAYATAAWVMGADGPAWALTLDGYESMTVFADDTVLCTPGFPDARPAR